MTSSTVEDIDAFGGIAAVLDENSENANALSQNNFQADNGLPTEKFKTDDFIIYHKNVRGLTSDDRITELLFELDDLPWDAITLNETMRTTRQEHWVTTGGHVFMASGYSVHTRGVAILVHNKF